MELLRNQTEVYETTYISSTERSLYAPTRPGGEMKKGSVIKVIESRAGELAQLLEIQAHNLSVEPKAL